MTQTRSDRYQKQHVAAQQEYDTLVYPGGGEAARRPPPALAR